MRRFLLAFLAVARVLAAAQPLFAFRRQCLFLLLPPAHVLDTRYHALVASTNGDSVNVYSKSVLLSLWWWLSLDGQSKEKRRERDLSV